jgi:hypothetical protein
MIGEWFEKGGGVVQRDVYTKYFRYTAKRADIQSIAIYRRVIRNREQKALKRRCYYECESYAHHGEYKK